MAAIIAQMAAANRERKKRALDRGADLIANKSNVTLFAFDGTFDPVKHNRYMRHKAEKEKRKAYLEEVKGESEKLFQAFSW